MINKIVLMTLCASLYACAQSPAPEVVRDDIAPISTKELSQKQPLNMVEDTTLKKDATDHRESKSTYWIQTGTLDILDINGNKIGRLKSFGPYTVYETANGLSRIDPIKDHWVNTDALSNTQAEQPKLIKSFPSTGPNTVNLEDAIRKREDEEKNRPKTD